MRSNSLPHPFFLFLVAPVLHLATATATSPPSLFARTISCESGDEVCGQTCIPSSYTCCPSGDGGCPADTVCQTGDNGLYGCCPTGDICQGPGGAQWILGDGNDGQSATGSASVSIVVGTATATSAAALPDKTSGAAAAAAHKTLSGSGLLGLAVAVVVGMA
ncbi:hypothetical protein DV737_g348, partial [Chaetothyriales sp. CBS 132003]